MKNTVYAMLLALLFFSCKKQGVNTTPNYLEQVQASLRDSLSLDTYNTLDFSRSSASGIDSLHINILRIPLTGKSIATDFLVVRTDETGHIIAGRFISIAKDTSQHASFTGAITYRSIRGTPVKTLQLVKGQVRKPVSSSLMADEPVMDGGDLPPVIVSYTPSGGGFTYADWYNLLDMAGGDGGYTGGYYTPASGGGGGGGNGSAPSEQVDFEAPESKDAVDVNKLMNCFGATQLTGNDYTITIAVDLPVDNDPSKIFNWSDASPGHTFIEMYKNGGGLVQQVFGFYPDQPWKTVTGNSISAKVADDGGHEYQAMYTVTVSPAQFANAIQAAKTYATFDYNVASFNCADYALHVFRAAGGQLNVPQFPVPGYSDASNTPQGVYDAIQSLVLAGNKQAMANGRKQWIGDSHGPCN